MTTLKVKVSSKEKTTKELEDKIDDMRKLHWDKEKEAESARRELERRSFEKYEEAERLRLKLVETEQRAQEPDRLRRAHEDLERVYASLQHQYQVTAQAAPHPGPATPAHTFVACIFFAQNSSKNGVCLLQNFPKICHSASRYCGTPCTLPLPGGTRHRAGGHGGLARLSRLSSSAHLKLKVHQKFLPWIAKTILLSSQISPQVMSNVIGQ